MGVLNITPDSFSDGGRWLEPEKAIAHGLEMLAAGAEILDLGAESTRPGGGVYGRGADRVIASEEADRLLPVLEGLRHETDALLAVDTRKGSVARQVLAAGADLINDIGGLADPALASAVASAGCPVVVMHSRGEVGSMQARVEFVDTVPEVIAELAAMGRLGRRCGVRQEQLIYDPGIGFGKLLPDNLSLLRSIAELRQQLGRPILIGASRKSFLAEVSPAAVDQRLGGSLAAVAWAAQAGASIVRVHDVGETVQLLATWAAIEQSDAPIDDPVNGEMR